MVALCASESFRARFSWQFKAKKKPRRLKTFAIPHLRKSRPEIHDSAYNATMPVTTI
jgi:hypothetical protein